MKHILYANNDWDAAQNALNAGTLENPYIAAIEWYSGISIDYNTLEQQSCAQRGLCGDDPTNCHECTCEESYSDPASICDCEGGYYWGDECHDEPEPSDPCDDPNREEECTCLEQGGTWIGDGHTDPCDCSDAPNPQECDCLTHGGTWDGERCSYCDGDPECECNEEGRVWSDITETCYDSQEECECAEQGGSWEGSECVMPSDDPCDGDPECECNNTDGYHFWEDNTCHDCVEEWEELGYSSPEDCACDKRGEDSGVCPESGPCAGMEQDISDCEQGGGTWDWVNCMCNEAPNPCLEDPCLCDPNPDECYCIQQGGTWSGSECQMPSDE